MSRIESCHKFAIFAIYVIEGKILVTFAKCLFLCYVCQFWHEKFSKCNKDFAFVSKKIANKIYFTIFNTVNKNCKYGNFFDSSQSWTKHEGHCYMTVIKTSMLAVHVFLYVHVL